MRAKDPDLTGAASGGNLLGGANDKPSFVGTLSMQGQGRSRRGPEHIGRILESVFKEQHIEEPIRVHRVVLDWEHLAGEEISRHASAVYVEHGTLIVEVENPAWMHRLQMQEEELRIRINRHFGEKTIRQIRFRLGPPSKP
jgi:predicted nucleic acid-binding Zn ribbon protein